MKILRTVLMVLGAPALVIAGLTQIGGNPISKGQNTHFGSWVDYSPSARLALFTDAGDLNCWIKVRVPANSPSFSANLSTGAPLTVYTDSLEGSFQWIAIVAEGTRREEKFKWPSGSKVFVRSPAGNSASVELSDWTVFLSDKDFDSQSRAKWRLRVFVGSIFFLSLGIIGTGLEAYSRLQKAPGPPLTPQRAIEELIEATEGSSAAETKLMHLVLRKMIQGVPPLDAVRTLPLSFGEQVSLGITSSREFRARLQFLISSLQGYLEIVKPRPF